MNDVRKLALGTAKFGSSYGMSGNNNQKIELSEVRKIFDFARKIKISTLDTASQYGDSEKVLGKIGVSDFNLITKLPNLSNIEGNIEDRKDFIQKFRKIISDFIITYRIYVLQEKLDFAKGGKTRKKRKK